MHRPGQPRGAEIVEGALRVIQPIAPAEMAVRSCLPRSGEGCRFFSRLNRHPLREFSLMPRVTTFSHPDATREPRIARRGRAATREAKDRNLTTDHTDNTDKIQKDSEFQSVLSVVKSLSYSYNPCAARRNRTLARWCSGWALRGRSAEDWIGFRESRRRGPRASGCR